MNYQNEHPVHVKENPGRGICNQKKKKCLYFPILLFEWTPSDIKEMAVDLNSTPLSPSPEICPINHMPASGVDISHLRAPIRVVQGNQGLAQ